VVDLDAAHDSGDDLAAITPVQPVEASVDPLRTERLSQGAWPPNLCASVPMLR
jgi:hypothetical protein